MKRIGEILTRYKEAETVKDDVTYKQVTIGTNYKGVRLRGTKSGIEIGTKNQWLVKAGQFILSKIDARNSAFGIIPDDLEGALVTNDFMSYEVNEDEVDRDFFNVFLQSPQFLEACVKASRGNTNRKRVQEEFFLNYEVNLPDIDHQRLLIQKIERAKAAMATAEGEISHQQTLLGKLKQAILQEAIQGKLTADWRTTNPDMEPASELLKRIQAEKARLITEKKIRKGKPLPEINADAPPFEIPEEWEWCRLGPITRFFDYRGKTPKKIETGIRLITAKNVKSGFFSDTPRDYVSEESFKRHMVRGFPDQGDILFTTEAPLGNACQLDFTEQFALGQRIITIHPLLSVKRFFLLTLLSPALQRQFHDKASGITAKGIKSSRLVQVLVPLPPLAEQAAIVERVEALMATYRELEAEIERSRTHAADLLQAVLKEAFAPANSDQ